MAFLLGTIFLVINIAATRTGFHGVLVGAALFAVSLIFMFSSTRRGRSTEASLVGLLCYTWSSSWRNLLGGSFADVPVPWFYLIAAALTVVLVARREFRIRPGSVLLVVALVSTGLLATMRGDDFGEALNEFVTLIFVVIVGVVALSPLSARNSADFHFVLRSLVYAMTVTSLLIILQFLGKYLLGIDLVGGGPTVLIGGTRLASSLMFGDLSSATIGLSLAVTVVVLHRSLFGHPYLLVTAIIGGMAVSSARTGLFALIATMVLLLFYPTSSSQKSAIAHVAAVTVVISAIAYPVVRVSVMSNGFLSDNGRLEGWSRAIAIWFEDIAFGVGFGSSSLEKRMGMHVPHLSLLNLLTQAGLIFICFLVLLLLRTYRSTGGAGRITGRALLAQSLIGSIVVPGLFSARFLMIVFLVIMFERTAIAEQGSWHPARGIRNFNQTQAEAKRPVTTPGRRAKG